MITNATPNDASELNTLVNSAYRGDYSRKGWTTEADLLDGIRTDQESISKLLQTPNVTILKYTDNGQILGCVCLEKQQNTMYLGMLTVLPTLQGGGIGKQLMLAAEDYAQSQATTKISMTAISVRHELIAYYERRGYQKTGETKPFPMNDPAFGLPKQFLEFVVMEKEIKQTA